MSSVLPGWFGQWVLQVLWVMQVLRVLRVPQALRLLQVLRSGMGEAHQ